MQLKHFVRVVRGEQAPIVTPADNVKTLRVLNAVKRAAETGELVELLEDFAHICAILPPRTNAPRRLF